jgi:hypothetical protein
MGTTYRKELSMSISAVSSSDSTYQTSTSNSMDQMKKNLDALGSALSSSNLDDAKKAIAEIQKNAPKEGKTPSEITDLQKALDSGDVKAAQQAYAKIQQKMSQGRQQGGPPQGKQPPQGGQGDTVTLSSKSTASTTSSSDTKTYDKMDTNKDGTVSAQERLEYLMTQGTDTTASSSTEDATPSSSKNSAKSSAAVSNTYDKKDTNKDGTVSAQEKSNYTMKHASGTTSSSSTSPYSGKSSIETYA